MDLKGDRGTDRRRFRIITCLGAAQKGKDLEKTPEVSTEVIVDP